ncbi:MAG TPA: hydroxyacylglutathione hydrolase [Usitatibacter sp.]|nr:hydroxyacylglutathione hydrolase [Usitatibacter sp.]
MVQIDAVPAFEDNYFWVLSEAGAAAVVDPGDAEPVEQFLGAHGLALQSILATHHHGDHVGGVADLVGRWGCPVFGPARDGVRNLTRSLAEGDRLVVPGLDFAVEVLDVPGHTAGHIAYVHRGADPAVFCGDTLFACGCGRLFEGTPAQMAASLAKLASLPADTRVYCAHEYTLANIRFAEAVEPGNARLAERKAREAAKRGRGLPTVPSTVGEELATNPFLRCAVPEVAASAERHAGHRLAGPVEVFAEIREWKNRF